MTTAPRPDRRRQQEAAGVVGGLFERHGRPVYGVCRAMLRDVHEAEDATQQVFLSAHQALLRGADVREPGSWLATIARNECRGRIAAGMRRPLSVPEEDLDAVAATGDEHDRRVQLLELRAALADLPERQRDAVVLRYLYGLRYTEVATALGLSRPATEALLFRARRSLRIRLRPIVGAALVVPTVVREELALALPGFGGTGTGVAAAGVTGGLLAKLTAGPVGLKAATAVVAVSTVGAVGTVPSERVEGRDSPKAPEQHAAGVASVLAMPRGDDDAGSRPASGASSRSAGASWNRGGVSSGDRETEQESSGAGSDGGDGGESPEPAMSSSGHGGESSGHDAPTSSGLDLGTSVEAAAPPSSGPGGGDSGTSGHEGGAEPTAVPSGDSSGSGSGGDSLTGGSSGSGSGSSGHSGGDAPDD